LGSTIFVTNHADAKDKYDLSTREQEANVSCRAYIVATAKDPDSVKFPEDGFGVTFGTVLFRNHLYITNIVYGRNTYGAVLKHNIVCDALCKQNVPCQVIQTSDAS
jgi:hypothetical protein